MPPTNFTFAISLSVLNHLGRNLYRSFITVIGEAVSNSWDAGAKNVWITVDRESNYLVIKDDGKGMDEDDFQNKFLKIGYSKRSDLTATPPTGRTFIGRKGIGKLALLSCAERITVISKAEGGEYVGGVIDNTGLDEAIEHDLTPDNYPLESWDNELVAEFTEEHEKGTIIYFENIKEGIRNSLDFLRKSIALYFRFSIIDPNFKIHFNGTEITINDIQELAEKTQFLWVVNSIVDPYVEKLKTIVKRIKEVNNERFIFKGFIATVIKPRHLKIINVDDRIAVDLFVNGRLRERDILKHIPTSRVVENYMYGQIHFDRLDIGEDRFTSSREGIVADDPLYKDMLDSLKEFINSILLNDWDEWRKELNDDGDPDNPNMTKKDRKAQELYNEVSKEYSLPPGSDNREKVNEWISQLKPDATFNVSSYTECFLSENLVRKYIREQNIALNADAIRENGIMRGKETRNKADGNVNIDLRENDDNLSYLDMKILTELADVNGQQNTLVNDGKEYKPIRDAIMHTALITQAAKTRLTSVYDNIKARIRNLLS